MKIEAVIFDLDGLMIDSERLTRNTFLEVCDEMNIVGGNEYYNQLIGGGDDIFDAVAAKYPQFDCVWPIANIRRNAEMEKRWNVKNSLNRPGLIELLTYLKNIKMSMAVASSSPIDYVLKNIRNFDPYFEFDTVTAGDQVKKAKPDPEVFLKTAQKLNIDPRYCLVIEDSKLGTIAAKRAGMHCITILDLVQMDNEFKNAIDFQLDSLLDVIDFLKQNHE